MQQDDVAIAGRTRQQEKREGNAGEAQDEADSVSLRVQQRPYAHRGDHQAQRLREGNRAILPGAQMESIGKVGQDGAQHGCDHSVDKDRENSGKNQHRLDVLSNTLGKHTASRQRGHSKIGRRAITARVP